MKCPNKSNPEYIKLVNEFGEGIALGAWTLFGEDKVPTIAEANQLLSGTTKKSSNLTLDKRITGFIKSVGGSIRNVDQIVVDGKVVKATAVSDVINRAIQIANGKGSIDTLPEEAAHIFVQWLPKNSLLLRDMIKDIPSRPEYKQVMKEYSGNSFYQDSEGKVDIDKIARESIGKVIAQNIVNQHQDKETKNWFKRLIDWVKKTFKGVTYQDSYEQAASEILGANTSSLDMKAIKAASDKGEYYFQLSPEKIAIANKQLQDVNVSPIQKQIIQEIYLDPHDKIFLEPEEHVYKDTKIDNPTIYTSVTTAIGGKKNIGGYDDNREWGNDFDKLLEGVVLGKKIDDIQTSDKIKDVKESAYNYLAGIVSGWTADGSIALPQVIVANTNENVPGAVPVAGSIDLLLIAPNGDMKVIDLKTSWDSKFNRKYSATVYKTGEGSLLPGENLSKSKSHSIQVMTYVKLLNLKGFPVREARTEHIALTTSGEKVTSFKYEGSVQRKMSENQSLVDKIIPSVYQGKNRLDELNAQYGIGNPAHAVFDSEDEKIERERNAKALSESIPTIFKSLTDWKNYLEDVKHLTMFNVNDNSIRKVDDLITSMEKLYQEGKEEQIYPEFLKTFGTHVRNILKVIDPKNVKDPNYIHSVKMAKKYIDTFKPFLVGSFAAQSNTNELFIRIDGDVRAVETAIIGAINAHNAEIIRTKSLNHLYDDTKEIEKVLKLDKDVSSTNMWADTLGNSGELSTELLSKKLASARQKVIEATEEASDKIKEAGEELYNIAGKTKKGLYNFIRQKSADGKVTERIVSQRGIIYNDKFDEVNFPLKNLDGSNKEYIKESTEQEDLEKNKELTRLKEKRREFIQGEKTTIDWNENGIPKGFITTKGDYHEYKNDYIEKRDSFMHQDNFGRWIPNNETDAEYITWRNETHDYIPYTKADRVWNKNTHAYEPTGIVTETSGWFPKRSNTISREYASDGTDLWDPEYRKIMNPKTEIERSQKKYYEFYVGIMRDLQDKLPGWAAQRLEKGYIPTVKADFIQQASEKDSKVWDITMKGMRNFFNLSPFTSQKDTDKTGSSLQTVPILFMSSMQDQKLMRALESEISDWAQKKEQMKNEPKKWSAKMKELKDLYTKEQRKMVPSELNSDMTENLMAMVHNVETYSIMSEMEDTIWATREGILFKEFKQGKKIVNGENSNILRMLDTYLNNVYYNDSTYNKTVADAIIKKLMVATSTMSIPFNLLGSINNKGMARVNNRLAAIGSNFFKWEAYNRAIYRYNTEVLPGVIKSASTHFGKGGYSERKAGSKDEALTHEFNMVRHAHSESKLNLMDFGYKLYEWGEYEVQSTIGNAILDSVMMRYTGPRETAAQKALPDEISVHDAHKFDSNTGYNHLIEGYKYLDKNGNIAEDQKDAKHAIINRIHETNDRIHGNYDPANATMLASTLAGRMAIQFHKWIFPNFKERFQAGKFDENLGGGMDIEGRWWGSVGQFFRNIREVGLKTEAWNTLTDHQKSNLKKDIADLMYFAMFLTSVHIVKSLAAGIPDDDPYLKKMANWLQYQSNRGMQEVSIFIPVLGAYESYQLVQNPFAATASLVKYAQLLHSSLQYPLQDDQERTYQRGNFKGQLKVVKQARDITPLFREINRITNLQTVNTFYIGNH